MMDGEHVNPETAESGENFISTFWNGKFHSINSTVSRAPMFGGA
jgi:hypothetical protein